MAANLALILSLLLIILGTCAAYVEHMAEEDVEWVEKNILSRREKRSREKRSVGIELPIDFSKLPRFDVATVEHHPYMYIERPAKDCDKAKDPCKPKYKGFLVDLMMVIARRLRRFVRFYEPADGKFGAYDEATETWSGMIGEVIKREKHRNETNNEPLRGMEDIGKNGADIAAAPITITAEREKAVDFVIPFAHLGLTVLIKKPEWKADWPYNFDILKPLAPAVWGSAVVAMVVVWLFLWMMNRYNPYEYGERRRRNLATDEEATLFNITGSFWFMFTLLQWQGYDRSPRSIASKCMGCFWMCFVTVFLVVYIGAYVNNLFWASTVHGRDPTKPTVSTLADLVSHKEKFTYGTMEGSNTLKYITEVATGEEFELMKDYLTDPKNADKLVANFSAGVSKVRAGRYGFICESMMARYIMNTRPCDLTSIADFGTRSYGLAVPRDCIHLEEMHTIILEMIEEGDIERLEQKWFEIKGECWNVTIIESLLSSASQLRINKPKQVNLDMFWSGIVLIIIGFVFSCMVAVAEILWFKYRGRYSASNRQRTQQLTNEDDGHI